MADFVFFQAAVDFVSDSPLKEIGEKVASTCFGGGKFIGENEGIWDEVPAMRLDRHVLGLEIVLGGGPGEDGYTLEVASKDPLGGELPTDPAESVKLICEFSRYLSGLVATIPDVELRPPES